MSAAMRERLLPWLVCLPALVFVLPVSPLVGDPYPHLAGAGLAAVLLLPLALALQFAGARPTGVIPFLLLFAWSLCVVRPLAPISDVVEARRALLVLASVPLSFAAGATLEARGRETLAWLSVGIAALLLTWALANGASSGDFSGTLGNSGWLSQAALPGAVVGAVWLARKRGRHRALGGIVLALFLVHASAAPVLAGAHSLLAALGFMVLRGGAQGRRRFAALALLALLAPFLGVALRTRATTAGSATVPLEHHDLAGLGVRGLVAVSALHMASEHAVLGVGPGQFQAAFPPYRDPREIEISRQGMCAENDTEVEHAHDDWLQALCELGVPGGILFAFGLLSAGRRAWRGLSSAEDGALAAAALALLVNACVHEPLLRNAGSSALAFALLGTPRARTAREPSRWAAAACALPLLIVVYLAPGLISHGAALDNYIRSAARIDELVHEQVSHEVAAAEIVSEYTRARAAQAAAAAAEPLSAPALELGARLAPEESRAAAWDRMLEVRPNAVEAWEKSAGEFERAGNAAEAHARYAHALELSPTHPRILRNSARLECVRGDLELGLATIERLRAQGCLDAAWLEGLADELVLVHGWPERAARVLCGKPLAELVPEELHARALAAEKGQAPADALECLAQLLWARQNVAAGKPEIALRNYRQVSDRSRAHREGAAPPYRFEMAAAEVLAGRKGAAAGMDDPDDKTWLALPSWARDALKRVSIESRSSSRDE